MSAEQIADREAFRAEVFAQFGCTVEDFEALSPTRAALVQYRRLIRDNPEVFQGLIDRRREQIAARADDGRAMLLACAKETGCPLCLGDCPLDRSADDPDVCRCGAFDWSGA